MEKFVVVLEFKVRIVHNGSAQWLCQAYKTISKAEW
jgi:hypothetical protein